MAREIFVFADLDGAPLPVGRLWTRVRNDRETATFEYDLRWLDHPGRFSLEPALALGPGPFHTILDAPMFGAIGDSAPDRWGRTLMRRMERRRAETEGRAPRALLESDYLLLVDDEARQGALRFAEREGGPFLREPGATRIPPLLALPRLLAAADHVAENRDTDDDLRLLIAPGSSLGGTRPKASVRDHDGRLAIAKFPRKDDDVNAVLWEAVALALAGRSGIDIPRVRTVSVAKRAVLLSTRFDRDGARRIPFLSAMSLLGARDRESRTYLEIVDAIRQHGAAPKDDIASLWRRVVFNILISNTDDHLRNHGFLYDGRDGWRLSPAYDLNPVPADIKPRVLTTAIAEHDSTASLALAMDAAPYFGLRADRGRTIAAEVGRVTATWRDEAKRHGLARTEIDRMASAFEHRDLEMARR